MGMMVGSSGGSRHVIELRDANGNLTGTISVSTSKPSSKTKKSKSTKKKRLNYNHKKIAKQILMSKTSNNSRRVVTRAREEVVMLLRKQMSGNFDETEIRHAIIHARKMERIARKQMKHLREEEKAEQSGKCMVEKPEKVNERNQVEEQVEGGLSQEELEELLAEYEELMDEMEELNGLDEVMKEYMGATIQELTPEQLEQLRKKHRAQEAKEIMEADMKYLQAMFNRLEKEKANIAQNGVSLELQGVEMPVEVSEIQVAEVEGTAVDVTV